MKLMLPLVSLISLTAIGPVAADTPFLGDYNAELREGKHVNVDLMVQRLSEFGANTYMWLIWHSPNDWDGLHDFAPPRPSSTAGPRLRPSSRRRSWQGRSSFSSSSCPERRCLRHQ